MMIRRPPPKSKDPKPIGVMDRTAARQQADLSIAELILGNPERFEYRPGSLMEQWAKKVKERLGKT